MKTIDSVTIICPYINAQEIIPLKNILGWKYNVLFEEDTARIGSDLSYQKLWNSCDTDIFIMHADMTPVEDNWLENILEYVNKYPEAGLFGCKLLYPVEDQEKKRYIQSAGGWFDDNKIPQHYGSGLDIDTKSTFKNLEIDEGQYDKIVEVAWSTFGGIYIRREVLNDIGNFDPAYEWSYNRDVDYCLQAREKGWKIYQIPVPINHFESKDNKKIRHANPEMNNKEARNLTMLQKKWKDKEIFNTLYKEIDNG